MKVAKSKFFFVGLAILLLFILCGCAQKEQEWPGYGGSTEGYTYYYEEGRDRLWEEDILFMADKYLQGHPKLSDSNFSIKKNIGLYDDTESEYSNALYDEELRKEYIEQINRLIPEITELDDDGVRYEAMRISALLKDAHSTVSTEVGDTLPICFESIGKEAEYIYCTVRATRDYEHLLGSRLLAINDISIEEIVAKFDAYIPHENDYWLSRTISRPFEFCELTQKAALKAIGVVDMGADSVEVLLETEKGSILETIRFIPWYEFSQLDLIDHYMVSNNNLKYSRGDNFWYTVLEDKRGPFLYARFSRMREQSVSFYQFYTMITSELNSSEIPLKLVIDFRDNGGGELQIGSAKSFANAVNRYQTNGTYILINGGCFSAGMLTPYVLAKLIDGAKLVGSPTGQPGNSFGAPFRYDTPNYKMSFYVSDNYIYGTPELKEDAIYPDVIIYQTWEDYQNDVDSVLEYVLNLK